MANLNGKAYGFCAFTATRPGLRTLATRFAFVLIRLASPPIVRKLLAKVELVADQTRLVDLQFIHFARWAIIRRKHFRRLSPDQPAEKLKHDYMLFASNFNGDWAQYIDAFSAVVPGGMDLIWRWSERYPMAKPITPFLAYIRRCQFDTDYYYGAYTEASTRDIRSALSLNELLMAFDQATRGLDDGAWNLAWHRFVPTVQQYLATTGLAPWADDPLEPILPGQQA